MAMKKLIPIGLSLALTACTTTDAPPPDAPASAAAPIHGGLRGADRSIEAIQPEDEPVRVGLAGDDPADIARYLLASGAQSARLSPDGETLAISWSITGTPQIWLLPAAGGQPRQLTFGNGITFFRWTPDGAGLVYGADNDGDLQEAYYHLGADGVSERLVLPAVSGGFRRFGDFNPDGALIYASTERNQRDFDIYVAPPGGQPRLIYEGRYAYVARSVSPGGSLALVTEFVGEDADHLHLLDLGTGSLRTLAAPEVRANHGGGGFAWAGDNGFYYAVNSGREFAALAYHDLASGASRRVEAPEHDVSHVTLCGHGGRYLAWTTNEDGFFRLHLRDRATGNAIPAPPLPEGVYELSGADAAPRLAIRVNGWRTPGDVIVWDIEENRAWTAFASHLAGLDPERLIRPESIRLKARDGLELQGLLYLPDAASRTGDGPPPVIFDVHGGPTGQSTASFNAAAQYHLDRGVAVFLPNVRGSIGLGRTYATLDDREKRLDSVRDLVDMLAFLRADGRVDTRRAAVKGASYGGYLVNAVLAAHPEAFRAGVSLFGVGDWVAALEVAPPEVKASDRIEYGDISEPRWREFYREISPVAQARRIRVPVLYSHGINDPVVDIAETEVMVKALRANQVEARFIRIPDEGHGWRKLKNQLFYFRREAEFMADVLAANK